MMISVCLASFNGEKYIEMQIKSILSQITSDSEVIISDDGSTDGTVHIIKMIDDRRIKLLAGPRRGLVKNFEHALKSASGGVIFLCDQDDVWLPNKVTITREALLENDLVISDAKIVNSDLSLIKDSLFDGTGIINNNVIGSIMKNPYTGCCMAFNRKVLEYALPFPNAIAMHDWWIGLIASCFCRVKFIEQPLILYRRHESNVSETGKKSTASFLEKLIWRLKMVYYLMKRVVRHKCGLCSTPYIGSGG